MKLGIIGLEGAGKTTLFQALTRNEKPEQKAGAFLGTVQVPDERVGRLSAMYQPKKTTYAQVLYSLPASAHGDEKNKEAAYNIYRACDALVHVVRNFQAGAGKPDPSGDLAKLESELVFSDFVVIEKRLERIAAEQKRGRPINAAELDLLVRCKNLLEKDQPLRTIADLADAPELRGFTLLSAKPMLYVFNNGDDDPDPPARAGTLAPESHLTVRGGLEAELVSLADDDLAEFMAEYGIESSARERAVRRSYELLGLISFFTVGEDEVKAWTIRRGTVAVDAADEIHSDIKKGFIRAEVVSYNDLIAAGSHAQAKKLGQVRLEGKTYEVTDGDIINFRFNV